MLRVGLTGGLGSGKSTVGAMLAGRGAHVLEADAIGRELMEPGQAVYRAIADRFGPGVVRADGSEDGSLDRAELARLAFAEGRVEELNAIVHPAVIAKQAEMAAEIGAREPDAVVVVESALIFETKFGGEWRDRFDRLVLVTAEDEVRVRRYVQRASGAGRPETEALAKEARRRMAAQMPDAEKAAWCDFVLRNDGTVEELEAEVSALWESLRRDAGAGANDGGEG